MDIKLMNYGRGAGKTYTLRNWALEKPDNRVVVTTRETRENYGSVYAMNLYTYGLATYDSMRGRKDLEVALDDFDLTNVEHLHVLRRVLSHKPKTVILATTYETMPTDATRELNEKFGLGAKIEGAVFSTGNRILDAMQKGIDEAGEELEPVQRVYAKDLRIGDYVLNRGYVTALGPSHYGATHLQVTLKDSSPHFEGVLHSRVETLLDVDITKRK